MNSNLYYSNKTYICKLDEKSLSSSIQKARQSYFNKLFMRLINFKFFVSQRPLSGPNIELIDVW